MTALLPAGVGCRPSCTRILPVCDSHRKNAVMSLPSLLGGCRPLGPSGRRSARLRPGRTPPAVPLSRGLAVPAAHQGDRLRSRRRRPGRRRRGRPAPPAVDSLSGPIRGAGKHGSLAGACRGRASLPGCSSTARSTPVARSWARLDPAVRRRRGWGWRCSAWATRWTGSVPGSLGDGVGLAGLAGLGPRTGPSGPGPAFTPTGIATASSTAAAVTTAVRRRRRRYRLPDRPWTVAGCTAGAKGALAGTPRTPPLIS